MDITSVYGISSNNSGAKARTEVHAAFSTAGQRRKVMVEAVVGYPPARRRLVATAGGAGGGCGRRCRLPNADL